MTDASAKKGFLRENWLWILLPFLIVAAVLLAVAATVDLRAIFPMFYNVK